jgi:hypothetical protein
MHFSREIFHKALHQKTIHRFYLCNSLWLKFMEPYKGMNPSADRKMINY